ALHEVLDEAIPLVRYSIDRVLSRFDLKLSEQRSRAEAAAFQVLLPMKNTALASEYLGYLADRFNMSDEEEKKMRQRFDALPAPRRPSVSSASSEPNPNHTGTSATASARSDQSGDEDASQAPYRSEVELRIENLERELLFLYIEEPPLRNQLTQAFESTQWVADEHSQIASELIEISGNSPEMEVDECLSLLTARLPAATASLSAARMREFSGITSTRLANMLLFSIRETKLQAAIESINGARRLLADSDPQSQQLFRQLVPLQQELAELRKRFRGSGNLS
ncbi:MAG: hypothetical protein FWD45_04830, partial [Coriobacteriia bacterium]|nr:hypothetical protein [Coriobacteriia bacterium]